MRASVDDIIENSISDNYENSLGFFPTTSLQSCLNYSSCNETDNCVINNDCYLNNDICSDGICNFKNMTIGAKVYVFYSGNDGAELNINLTGEILFLSGNRFIFFGKKALSGGNGGVVNISVPGLFNTTGAYFTGNGGEGGVMGEGGVLQLNYWGLYGYKNLFALGVNLTGENNGRIIYKKDTEKLINGARDVDINNDGIIDEFDIRIIKDLYGVNSSNISYVPAYDIYPSTTYKIDIRDLMRIGLQYGTR